MKSTLSRAGGGNCSLFLSLLLAIQFHSDLRGAVPFTEEAASRGLTYTTVAFTSMGAGVAFVDLDDDGDADVVAVGRADGVVGVFENIGGGVFVDHSATSGIPAMTDFSGVVSADYDLDGRLDLYFSNYFVPNVLCHNDGNFQFTDVSVAAGVDDAGWGMGCTWGDYDGDDWPDLYLSNRSVPPPDQSPIIPNRLYHNRHDGTFEDVAVSLGVDLAIDDRVTLQSVFFDFDNDGDADLYTSTDKGTSIPDNNNRLFENTGGAFSDISVASGTDVSIDSMGVGVGDFDGNGFQDLYCTNVWPGHKLLMNNGDGTFTESAAAAGMESLTIGWGAAFFDYDNDGYQDIYVCDMVGPNELYTQSGTWPASDIALAVGVADSGASFGIAIADIDDDGDIDLLVQNSDEPLKLYINHEGELRNWIKFSVFGEGSDRFAIGAQVRVRVGSVWQMREILAGGNNYKGQNEFTVHFGLAGAQSVDEAVVSWPGGHSRTLTNLAANQTYQVHPAGSIPTLSSWGLVLMMVGLMVLATVALRWPRSRTP